jgi:hypothetical protein
MWMDIINYIFYNENTVPQGDWGFFLFYTFGDFVSRFFFNPQDSSNESTIIV